MTLYTENDVKGARAQVMKMERLTLIPAVPLLIGIVISLVLRMEWLTSTLTVLLGAFLIFFWDLKIRPVRAYARMLSECTTGITHEYTGVVKEVSAYPSTVDGVSYQCLMLTVGKLRDEDDDRLLYVDQERPLPPDLTGQTLTVTAHDRTIIAWTRVEA